MDERQIHRRINLISEDLKDIDVIEKESGTKVYQRVETVDLHSLKKLTDCFAAN